jgi:hypothetical protein
MKFSKLALYAAERYLGYVFARARKAGGASRAVFFDRGAFSSDVRSLSKPGDVVIDANVLKRLFVHISDRHRLEQVIGLFYTERLQSDLAPLIRAFGNLCSANQVHTVYFGGVDYFEVVAFEEEARRAGARSVAIFHENYTVPLTLDQTRHLLSSYPAVPSFSAVYAIGPPAKDVLDELFDNVLPMSVARFQYAEQCHDFEEDLLIVPFAQSRGILPVIKHKNRPQMRQFLKVYGKSARLRNVTSPGASYLCARSRLVICYNSLVYYEALAHGHLIAVPRFAEAKHGALYTQHLATDDLDAAGVRTFASKQDLDQIMTEAAALRPQDRLKWTEGRKALLRQSFFDAGAAAGATL